MMHLYSYWRSSAAYRVRIALNLKGVAVDYRPVNLLEGEHKSAEYLAVNPAGLVPALVLEDGRSIHQSLAILLYLEDEYPEPALLPTDPFEKARVISMATTVACEIHPLNNIGVLNYLRAEYSVEEPRINEWMHQWLDRGFTTLEQEIQGQPYCNGEQPGLADVLLVPMVYNALRFKYPLAERQPTVLSVWKACNELPAFIAAQPEQQPDAP